ncbi:MAG TPA: tetratricopeptide repeat protein [Gammaproteobacteria bacterium]|nr:tetratricopeptide repeat protein [Gammaproteobacteria bacterium]
MDRVACNYHPRLPARWQCPRCEVSLCPGCANQPRGPLEETPDCPLCEGPLESLGLGNVIVPFWRRLPRIFAYPLQPAALLYLLGLSLISLAVTFPLVGWLVLLLVTLAILQYSFRVMAHTASGHMRPPEVTMRGEEDVTPRVIALGLVYAAVTYLSALAGARLGLPGYLAASLFFSLMLPASILIVGLEQGFLRILFKAINPVSLTALALRIGPAYLLLFLFTQLLSGAGGELAELLAGLVPAWAAAGAIGFGLMYMHLVTFHLLGYVIYQYHEELGYEVDVRRDESGGEDAAAAASVRPELTRVDVLLKEGRLEQAEELLRRRIDADPLDLEVWRRYYRVLEAGGDAARLVHESKDYISALLLAGRRGRAVEVAARALERDPAFRPAKPEQVLELARTARDGGRPRLALGLMNGFGRAHPDHPDLPQVSVLSARILSEDLRLDDRARPILEGLLRRFPEHETAAEAHRLLNAIGPA